MSSDYNNNIWKAVLSELQNTIPQRWFDLWFKETHLVGFTETLMKIQVSNDVIRQKINEKCMEDLKKVIFKCTGHQPVIEFIIAEKKGEQVLFNFEEASQDQEQEQNSHDVKVEEQNVPAIQTPALNLNTSYTFLNFVVGSSNHLAHSTSLEVAKSPGKAYNPLFVYGSVGLGKTHLLQAICHELLRKGFKETIVYLSCEEFINEFIVALEKGDINSFRYKYRHVSVLLIDDVHFLANKDKTQEEFFHTFNTLYNSNKQIILSSDSPPSQIPELKERLVSRFKWGMVAPIHPPSFETRVAIVKKKAKIKGYELPDNVCEYISENVISNIRELEGAVNHLLATAELYKREITVEFARRALKDVLTVHSTDVSIHNVVDATAKCFSLKMAELKANTRNKTIVFPRQVGMYLAKSLTKCSLQEIGSFFGRDHTTVLHAIDKVKACKETNPKLAELLKRLEKDILNMEEKS